VQFVDESHVKNERVYVEHRCPHSALAFEGESSPEAVPFAVSGCESSLQGSGRLEFKLFKLGELERTFPFVSVLASPRLGRSISPCAPLGSSCR
jgi:hypothetical protein